MGIYDCMDSEYGTLFHCGNLHWLTSIDSVWFCVVPDVFPLGAVLFETVFVVVGGA